MFRGSRTIRERNENGSPWYTELKVDYGQAAWFRHAHPTAASSKAATAARRASTAALSCSTFSEFARARAFPPFSNRYAKPIITKASASETEVSFYK